MSKRLDIISAFEHMDEYYKTLIDKFDLQNKDQDQRIDIVMPVE